MNHNVKESHKDAMDIPLFVEMISKIKPKFFAMDNLPLSLKEAFTIERYKEMLPDYDLFPEWISNYHYGNLQAYRKRYFMIGARKELEFIFVPGEKENTLQVKDVLEDLPFDKDILDFNHIHKNPVEDSKSFKDLDGKRMTFKQVAEAFLKSKVGANLYYKNSKGEIKKKIGPCKTNWDGYAHVLMGCDNIFHPKTGMPLTIRERARIQGCPDDMIFYGSHQQQIKQTGKFMPVQFPKYLTQQILCHLEGIPFKTSSKRLITSNPNIDVAKDNYCQKFGYKNQNRVCQNCWLGDRCSLKSFDLLK